ncbi:MAG: hypothetical protein IJ079_05215 [Lachnospiraceae bacterium]|nr:hypothetical protein [Lachnospiraceae bacterium]
MNEQCPVCGSTVDNVSGVCPVCGAVLPNSTQTEGADPIPAVNPENASPVQINDNMSGFNLQKEQPQDTNPAQTSGYGVPNGNVQPGGYGVPNGNVQPGGYGMPNGNIQPSSYGSQPGGMYGGAYQQPYNYQNPNNTSQPYQSGTSGGSAPKQKLFSILSLVCSLVSFLTCCVPVLGLITGIAAIAFAIVAFIKKQSKVPAVIGLILGIIGSLAAVGTLSFDLMMKSQTGTSFGGLLKQLVEVQSNGVTEIEDIIFLNPADNQYYALYSDGTYETSGYDSGRYKNYSYMDYYNSYSNSDAVTYGVIYAMKQGYQVKDVTILDFPDASFMFIVPSDFKPGDDLQYIQYPDSYTDMDGYKMITVPTQDINSYY